MIQFSHQDYSVGTGRKDGKAVHCLIKRQNQLSPVEETAESSLPLNETEEKQQVGDDDAEEPVNETAKQQLDGDDDEEVHSSPVNPPVKRESKAMRETLRLERHRSFYRIDGLLKEGKDITLWNSTRYNDSQQAIVDIFTRLEREVDCLVNEQLDGGPIIRTSCNKRGRYSHRELISMFCRRATVLIDNARSYYDPARYIDSRRLIDNTFSLLMENVVELREQIG
jgi:hypothetical protein